MPSSRLIEVTLGKNGICYIYMYHIFFYSFFDEHIGCMLTIKLLEENIGKKKKKKENIGSTVFDMGLSSIFLHMSP